MNNNLSPTIQNFFSSNSARVSDSDSPAARAFDDSSNTTDVSDLTNATVVLSNQMMTNTRGVSFAPQAQFETRIIESNNLTKAKKLLSGLSYELRDISLGKKIPAADLKMIGKTLVNAGHKLNLVKKEVPYISVESEKNEVAAKLSQTVDHFTMLSRQWRALDERKDT